MIDNVKKSVMLTALFLLTGCGFTPVYGSHGDDGSPVSEQMNLVAIDSIRDRSGQFLRNELIDRMYGKGRPAQPLYHLVVLLRQTEEDLGIQADATSTRTMLNMYATYVLNDLKGKEVLHGTAHSISSFNTLVDEYGNLSAHNAAVQRTLSECGEQIVNRLSLYFAEKAEGYAPLNQTPLAPAKSALPGQPQPVQPSVPSNSDQVPPPSPDDSFSTIRR